MDADSIPTTDVIILGAGAAGLMAAIRAGDRGRSVVLVEKNRRPGVKILMSGGTRCNVTNARGIRDFSAISGPIDPAFDRREALGSRSILKAFGDGGKFLGPALRAFDADRTVRFFEGEAVPLKVEGNGKVFPVSDRASDVLSALWARLRRSGATLLTETPALEVSAIPEGFRVRLPDRSLTAGRVILATGGRSYPGCGTTGDGYAIASAFGHTIVETRPALVPIRVEADWVADLKGLTIPDATASVRTAAGATLLERREAILFAHFGLTGPAILDVSRAVARQDGEPLDLVIDWLPREPLESLDKHLQVESRVGRRLVATLFADRLPKRLVESILLQAEVPVDRLGPDLTREERRRVLLATKSMKLRISGTLGFEKAEVTSGGVALEEVDPASGESRRQPGLHLIGEVLDLDGLIGGYNFQAAWSLGYLAGDRV